MKKTCVKLNHCPWNGSFYDPFVNFINNLHVFFSTGYLVDKYKNYELIFYMAGGELITAGIWLTLGSFCFINQKKHKDSQQKHQADVAINPKR